MPRLACYCDRYWTPLDNCSLPGAKQQRLPFQCPMDYVLDPIFLTVRPGKGGAGEGLMGGGARQHGEKARADGVGDWQHGEQVGADGG